MEKSISELNLIIILQSIIDIVFASKLRVSTQLCLMGVQMRKAQWVVVAVNLQQLRSLWLIILFFSVYSRLFVALVILVKIWVLYLIAFPDISRLLQSHRRRITSHSHNILLIVYLVISPTCLPIQGIKLVEGVALLEYGCLLFLLPLLLIICCSTTSS